MNTVSEQGSPSSPKTIFQLVKLLAANALPSASRSNSFIVNEVPSSIQIIADENIMATVLSRLLYSLVNHSENSCIRITANEYDDIVFVHLKSTRSINNDAIDNDLQSAQSYAKKMNGNIGLNKDEAKVTGIVFSFPNMHFNTAGKQSRTEAFTT